VSERDVYTGPDLERLVNARSVAVVGASPAVGSFGRRTLVNMAGFDGRKWPVNPKYQEVDGLACFPDLKSLPSVPDCVVLTVARTAVEPYVEECVRLGVGGVVIYASGYAETGKPDRIAQQDRLAAIARGTKTRVVGPNCIGILNNTTRNGMLFQPGYDQLPHIPGGIGVVSQSGAIGYTLLLGMTRGVGFSHYFAVGNQCDVDICDFMSYLVDDPNCRAILCLFEGVKSGKRLLQAGERALRADKPIVVYKMANSQAAGRAAMSHTGSLLGATAAYEAAFARTGMVAVDDLEDMLETAAFFAKVPTVPKGRGVGVVVTSGGAGVIAADKAEAAGVALPQPAGETLRRLAVEVPEFGSTANPCDVTGQVLNNPDSFPNCVAAFLEDPEYAALVFPVVLGVAGLSEQRARSNNALAEKHGKPIIAAWINEQWLGPGSDVYEANSATPLFRSMRRCMHALAAWWVRAAARERLLSGSERLSDPNAATLARAILMLNSGDKALSERASKALLSTYGVPISRERVADSREEAIEVAIEEVGFPCVLKVDSPDIAHKTEAGVVRLDLRHREAVGEAYDAIMANAARLSPAPRIDGVSVQEMVPPGLEMVVGMTQDPQLGPVLAVGLGGVMVELMRDTQVGLAPLGRAEALALIDRLKGRRLLDGFRGGPKVDPGALADILVRVSELAHDLQDVIAEIDVNPVILLPDRAVAVDALVIPKGDA
jgi:acetate---CoA ligase (ADP-forming)